MLSYKKKVSNFIGIRILFFYIKNKKYHKTFNFKVLSGNITQTSENIYIYISHISE